MKIYFERSGGLLGRRKSVTLDTDELSREEGEKLKRLLSSIGKPKIRSLPKYGADYIIYKIKGENIDIEVSDLTMHPSVRELIDMLNKYIK